MKAWKILLISACCLFPAAAMAQWSDNFDLYMSGSQLSGQGGWEPWDGDPGAANFYVSNAVSHSTANSALIDGVDDAVHRYSGYTSGQWEYIAYQYIPSGGTGAATYFILLNTYPATSGEPHWSLQLEMNPDTALVTDVDAAIATTLLMDQWVEIKVVIDLIADEQTVYYNGTALVTKSWTAGTGGGSGALNIGAVDLWGNGTTYPVYYDDMSLSEVTFATPTPTATPIPSGPGDWCNEPLTLTCTACVEGTTVGFGNHYDNNETCSSYIEGFEGADVVYQLVLNDVYSVTFLGQADYDADWAIVSACDLGETSTIACFDYTTVTGTPSCSSIDPLAVVENGDLEYEVILGPGTFYVWVDGFMTEEGNYALEVLCNPIPAGMECDAGSVWEQPGNSGTAYISDEYYPFFGAESFTGAYSIQGLKWWGIETLPPGAACTRDNAMFHVSLFQDSGGLPGTVVWEGDVTPDAREDSGEVFGIHGPIWAYHVDLPAPVILTDGWIGIQALESTDCRFGWVGVATGDFMHASLTGSNWELADDGLALCIEGAPPATPTLGPVPTTDSRGIGLLLFAFGALIALSTLRMRN